MPTLLKEKGFRFFFFSNEHLPKHIHIEKQNAYAKINLINLEIIESYGFNSKEISVILSIVEKNRDDFIKAWDEYFKA
jgi:hypothetical protein